MATTTTAATEIYGHKGWLTAYICRLANPSLNGKLDLSGIVQQTLAEALQDNRPLCPLELKKWLKTLLRRNYLDAVKYAKASKRDIRREGDFGEWESPGTGLTPSQEVSHAEELLALMNAMLKLPDDQQTAIRKRYLEGLRIERIASEMKKSTASVAGLLRRGLDGLREDLGKGHFEESNTNGRPHQ